MKPFPAALVLIFAIVLQVLAGPFYRAGSLAPDFPFLALAYLALFAPPRPLLLAAAASAVAIDLISLDPLGTRLAGYLPALWLMNRARRTLWADSMLLRAALTFGACLVAFEIEGAFVGRREWGLPAAWFEMKSALYTALLGAGAHAVLDRHRARLGWARDRFFA